MKDLIKFHLIFSLQNNSSGKKLEMILNVTRMLRVLKLFIILLLMIKNIKKYIERMKWKQSIMAIEKAKS